MTSSQLLLTFTVNQSFISEVNIVSVFNENLLLSHDSSSKLFIYSREGRHLSTITTNDNEMLYDATWTPRGNIVCTTYDKRVVIMSESGKFIATHTQIRDPKYLSVADDDAVYLADWETGVYHSANDGISWSLIFRSPDGWHCKQVIKVTSDHSNDFWTLERKNSFNYHLRVYSIDSRRSDGNVTWKDISTQNGEIITFSFSSLSSDGNMNIFLSNYNEKTVYVLPVKGIYHFQLLSSHHFNKKPCRLAVDKENQLLFVGQSGGVVSEFKIT